jgi:hypothetical protein
MELTRLIAPFPEYAVDAAIRAAKGEFSARAAHRTLKLTRNSLNCGGCASTLV